MEGSRRSFLGGGIAASLFAMVNPRAVWAASAQTGTPFPPTTDSFISAFCDTMIPRTDTPGAIDANVPAFIATIAQLYATPEQRATFIAELAQLDTALGGTMAFAQLPQTQRLTRLMAMDSAAMHGVADCRRPPADPVPMDEAAAMAQSYRLLKSLVAWGYGTSLEGGSQHLRIEMVPGEYNPDAPLADDWQNFSNETVIGQ